MSHDEALWVVAERHRGIGLLTLNRPHALNALSLGMVRAIGEALQAWRDDGEIAAVVIRGTSREGKSPAFSAGGDLRFFHQAALAGDPLLDDFFTEEYRLDHLVHRYPKPVVALMDGIVMGGGMGIAQGAALRVVTERTKMAMPETGIGLFPDVGGGWFLSRCPGRMGEYLALTGHVLGAGDAIALGLADVHVRAEDLPAMLESLLDQPMDNEAQVRAAVAARAQAAPGGSLLAHSAAIDLHFAHASVGAIVNSLRQDRDEWAQQTLAVLLRRSPLMLAVTLEQLRRARTMTLADDLRMERILVWHCFRHGETIEGIRALTIDKDRAPRWNPPRIEDLSPQAALAFFADPWPAGKHPLSGL
ncbi:enoyl-CoA hydratase/isomerase family protein [Piscinibacter sp. XHJ-5]|uniref:enoyl-CoA hydratase/isomerase family protein n=1 Tax=Piscinibacter sp. XHJ-5 TaxID=3037797 RepID=UPI0024534EEB|nr:enoyl-CoA hydratase/isomerase family protein [Piscinibacter sp. XHJ-5]